MSLNWSSSPRKNNKSSKNLQNEYHVLSYISYGRALRLFSKVTLNNSLITKQVYCTIKKPFESRKLILFDSKLLVWKDTHMSSKRPEKVVARCCVHPGAHLPQPEMWRPDRAQDCTFSLARNSCLNTSMRGFVSYAVEGVAFPQGPQRDACLTFPPGVYRAPQLSSRSFSSPTRWEGFADSPGWRRAADTTVLSWGTADDNTST